MELFIDTANLKEIEEFSKTPFIKGVTTNPSLIAKEGKSQSEIIETISTLIDGPISAEVTAEDEEGMLLQARKLHQIKPENIVIKLPMTTAGLSVCKKLHDEHIPTNVTLCFSLSQALLAFESHATYVSPFLGRLDDNGWDSAKLIEEIVKVKKNYGYETKIICASIRSVSHVETCALLGADIATVPYKVLKKLISHPLTDSGLVAFEKDSAKTKNV